MRLVTSFGYAIRGLVDIYLTETNFRLELAVAEGVLTTLWLVGFPRTVTAFALVFTGGVLAWEAMNGALERSLDLLGQRSEAIAQAKDRAAGSVLLVAGGAVAAALVMGWPIFGAIGRAFPRHPWVVVFLLALWTLTIGSPSVLGRRTRGR